MAEPKSKDTASVKWIADCLFKNKPRKGGSSESLPKHHAEAAIYLKLATAEKE